MNILSLNLGLCLGALFKVYEHDLTNTFLFDKDCSEAHRRIQFQQNIKYVIDLYQFAAPLREAAAEGNRNRFGGGLARKPPVRRGVSASLLLAPRNSTISGKANG
jgi:hypothetical protein